jgi:hypothetical protein
MESAQGAGGRPETVTTWGSRIAGSPAVEWLAGVAGSAWFAYASILAIQSKVLWGIWSHRDLSPGDTASYFVMASRWADHLQVDPAFYPLYHVLWGSLQWIVPDPFAVTILHRVLIALGTTALFLAVMRRLLTPGIAWALAVWWATLPIAYDVLYEIHLFGALAGLAIALVALRWSGLAGRATVFGLLLASALLVRNENVVAAVAFGAVWLGYEAWRLRKGAAPPWRTLAAAGAVPLLSVAVLLGLVSWRNSSDKSVFSQLSRKHQVNICQVYAQSLWQSGDVRAENPHAQCDVYTLKDFGQRFPSLTEAIAENPGAMARHFARNAGLVPAGLEIDFFNAKFGSISDASNPDYIPIHRGSWLVLAGSIAIVLVIATGAVLIWVDRRRWWNDWIRPRAWGWVALAAMGTSALYAALMTRPRPSYMFPLSILTFAALGMSLMVIASRVDLPRRARAIIPPLALAALILIPSHYRAGYSNPQIGPGERLQTAVSRLEPFRNRLEGRTHGLLAVYPATSACEYVGRDDPCLPVSWNYPIGETLGPELAGSHQNSFSPTPIDFIYADEYVWTADPGMRARLQGLLGHGWRLVAPGSTDSSWMLLERTTSSTEG